MSPAILLVLCQAAALVAGFDPLQFAAAPPVDVFGDGPIAGLLTLPLGGSTRVVGGAFFGDASLLLAYVGRLVHVAGDLSALYGTEWTSVTTMAPHPDGEIVVLSDATDVVSKFSSALFAMTMEASDSNPSECNGPERVVIQQTGNQRIFVMCGSSPEAICQYDADLSGRDCTTLSTNLERGLAIAPDDSFLVVRDENTLRKYTINDGAGTLTTGATLDISGSTTSGVIDLVILADDRIVLPDPASDDIEVVNAAFSSVSTIDVNSGTLGGINPGCDGPDQVAVGPGGSGDIVVVCDSSDSLLIISNDLVTTAFEATSPEDLGLAKDPTGAPGFNFGVAYPDAVVNIAGVGAGAGLFLGGRNSFGFVILDLTGGGTSGLAGSYGTPALALAQTFSSTHAVGSKNVVALSTVVGAVVFADDKVAYASKDDDALFLIASDYESLLDVEDDFTGISQMIPHPDDSAIVVDYSGDTIFKYSVTGTDFVQDASDYNPGECNSPSRAVVQQTGNQRIFVMCINSPVAICQYDSDLANRDCTSVPSALAYGLGIAPDDSFIIIRDQDTLRKLTINDGAGTLTNVGSLDISGSTTSNVFSLVVLDDYRIVVPDKDNDQLEVVNAAFSSVSAINVNSGSFGGINPKCDEPEEVATTFDGLGDIIVLCDASDNALVIGNDMATTAFQLEFQPAERRPFVPTVDASTAPLVIADASGDTLMVAGGDGLMLYDLSGGGTSGLAGSFDEPFLNLMDFSPSGAVLTTTDRGIPTSSLSGVVDFGDGSVALAMSNLIDRLLLVSDDFETLLDLTSTFADISQMVAHPDNSAIVLDCVGDTIYKYSSDGVSLSEDDSDSNASECNFPSRVVVQQTGNQRIFVMCTQFPDAVCQYNSDLTGRTCTSISTAQGIGIAPDDSYLIVRDNDLLRKYTINDGPGTISAGPTLDISGTTTAVVMSLVVLADDRIVIPDSSDDELEVVNAAFTSTSQVAVNSGTLGGITPECQGPNEVATDLSGLGDILIVCPGSDSLLVISNDLSTEATAIDADSLDFVSAAGIDASTSRAPIGFLPSGEAFYGGDNWFRVTGVPPVGAGGDPVVTDLAGHKFVVGTEAHAEYVLLRSPDRVDDISFTTSGVRGKHNDFFIDTVRVMRAGCGSVVVRALNGRLGTRIVGPVSTCMSTRLLHGDRGLLVVAIGDGSAAVAIVPHHEAGKTFSFLNVKVAGDVARLHRDHWAGILGDEDHVL